MAERRMFSTRITDSDAFIELPPTAQALYFHRCMSADDDGFCDRIRAATYSAHAAQSDLDMLVEKRFLLKFDSGIVVIKHWHIHNLIRKQRYHPTKHIDELSMLALKENGAYTEAGKPMVDQRYTNGLPNGNQCATEASLGKARQDKVSVGEPSQTKSRSVTVGGSWTTQTRQTGRNKRPGEQHNYDFEQIEADLLQRQMEGLMG